MGIYLLLTLANTQVGGTHLGNLSSLCKLILLGLELQSVVILIRGHSVRELGWVPVCSFLEYVIFNKENRYSENTFSVACCLRVLIFNAG